MSGYCINSYKTFEEKVAAVDAFIEENGDKLNFNEAKPKMEEVGLKVGKNTYIRRVQHYRIKNKPEKP